MKMSVAFAAAATLAVLSAVPAEAESTQAVSATVGAVAGPVSVSPGKMIYGANGRRIGAVYRVTAQGNPQLIIDGKLVTVPASTLSSVDGKVTTSLSKADIDRGN